MVSDHLDDVIVLTEGFLLPFRLLGGFSRGTVADEGELDELSETVLVYLEFL